VRSATGRQPETRSRRGRPSGRDRPGDGAGWDRARGGSVPSASCDLGAEWGIRGLAHAAVADNVISNGVKPPEAGRDGMGVKIAVVGGGSTYTPELVEGFARRHARLSIDELVLLDIDAERLAVVGGLAGRMLDRLDWGGRLVLSGDRDSAIEGADFVLIQLRVGGQAARLTDETLPPTFGVVGQETTGAGGLAKALRTVPVVLELAELTAKRGAPGAWIVDFTNPVGIVSQALLDAGHRAIGLCNVAINLQRGMAERYGVEPEDVELEHVGLNHLSWERAVRVNGVDRLPEILAGEGAAGIAEWVGSPAEVVRLTNSI